MDYEVGDTYEVEVRTLVRQLFFVRFPVKAVKKNFSPQNSTQFLQKFTAFSAFNAKRCGRFAVKKIFFSALFTANLTLFFDKTSIRVALFTSKQLKSTVLASKSPHLCGNINFLRDILTDADLKNLEKRCANFQVLALSPQQTESQKESQWKETW